MKLTCTTILLPPERDELTHVGIRVTAEDLTFKFQKCDYIDATAMCTVNWGDGTVETPYDITKVTHTYAQPGEYEITLTDALSSLSVSGTSATRQKEGLKIISFKANAPHLTELGASAFYGCANITGGVELPHVNTIAGTTTEPFAGCPQAFEIHFSKDNEAAIRASTPFTKDPQLGAPNAVISFDP